MSTLTLRKALTAEIATATRIAGPEGRIAILDRLDRHDRRTVSCASPIVNGDYPTRPRQRALRALMIDIRTGIIYRPAPAHSDPERRGGAGGGGGCGLRRSRRLPRWRCPVNPAGIPRCSNDRACTARARRPVSEAGNLALDAARRLTAAGREEFSRTCLMRQALGSVSTAGARMAFSRTVSALIRSGHLVARVEDDTLNDLVGVGTDLVDQLRAGDLDALASRIGGQIAVLSLPDTETARVSASRYRRDPVVVDKAPRPFLPAAAGSLPSGSLRSTPPIPH